ncbi:MAG: lysine--tRNA ligase [Phycisphaeraceae bacterium]|nr:lysine--tRNA ligase [Phycisphaeraceae bacterium]
MPDDRPEPSLSRPPTPAPDAPESESALVAARREKLARWRAELGITGYGHRVDGRCSLAEARSLFREDLHVAFEAIVARRRAATAGGPAATVEEAASLLAEDPRPTVRVAGRVVQHRAMGGLVFVVLRDETQDLQVSVQRAAVDPAHFRLAEKLDYGDIIVAEGRMGRTNRGEVCVWAASIDLHVKSLVPPPEKWHGLTDPETRYRQRYVDMYANPQTIRVFQARSRIVARIRNVMDGRGFLEVETPMMQPIAGGAAARPFVTHHNALGMPLFLRIAPELYLKRLLVGGLPRVYEINRNFRNEGIDRQHNPEFTMMEVYEAFGDCETMLELTESLLHTLASEIDHLVPDASPVTGTDEAERMPAAVSPPTAPLLRPFGDTIVDWARPFRRTTYGALFESALGFSMSDGPRVRERAAAAGVENHAQADQWLLVSALFDRFAEARLDPARPTFVTDFPSAISPLTRPHSDRPELAFRWELFVAGMEIANAYTELNDPDVQLARFTEQLAGADDDAKTFRSLDDDFIHALRVGMPPAGGLGIGIDRVVMLMTDQTSIRDVILFPLMRSTGDVQRAGPVILPETTDA